MTSRFRQIFLSFFLLAAVVTPAAASDAIDLDEARLGALAELPPLRGEALAPAELEGKVVVVTFFASWCPPCHVEFDNLAALKDDYGDDLEIIAVNIFEEFGQFTGTARLERFLDRKKPPFVLLGEGEAVAGHFGDVTRVPTLFVFDAEGAPTMSFIHEKGAKKTHVTLEELRAAVSAAASS